MIFIRNGKFLDLEERGAIPVSGCCVAGWEGFDRLLGRVSVTSSSTKLSRLAVLIVLLLNSLSNQDRTCANPIIVDYMGMDLIMPRLSSRYCGEDGRYV